MKMFRMNSHFYPYPNKYPHFNSVAVSMLFIALLKVALPEQVFFSHKIS